MAVSGFVLGTCIGSFLNVCIDRLPRRRSLVNPPSHCDACGKRLKAFELVPIASYLWLKGRCRYCGASLPPRILAVELGTGLLFAWLAFNYGFGISFLVLAFYSCLFLVLAVIDLEHWLILDQIVYSAIGISLILSPFWSSLGFPRSFPGGDSALHLFLGALTGGGIFIVPFILIILFYPRGMGWGDVKMAGLVGLVTGFPLVLVAMMTSFLSGGLTAGLLLLLRRKGRKDAIPFAPFLSLGAIITLLWGQQLVAWYLGQ